MSLPIDFVASATALECYEVCPRRFQHRYLDRLPTAGPEPGVARRMQRGDIFHRLVLWHDLGLDAITILDSVDDPELKELWESYLSFRTAMNGNGAILQHDQTLIARCGSHRVLARLDAMAVAPGGDVTIYDWKTSARPVRARLVDSPQSKVYPYVVWETLRGRDSAPLTDPSQIRLVYWFAADPDNSLQIDLNAGKLDDASAWLAGLLGTISADNQFAMTEDRTVCSSCEYLAHCGVRAEDGGSWELDEDYYQPLDVEDDSSFDYVVWPG